MIRHSSVALERPSPLDAHTQRRVLACQLLQPTTVPARAASLLLVLVRIGAVLLLGLVITAAILGGAS